MKIAIRLVLLGAVAALGFWGWTVFFPSPEKVLLKKISSLAATASVAAGDGNITRATKVSNLIGYFSTDAEIRYDVPELGTHALSGLDEIRETAAGGYTQVSAIQVQFFDAVAHVGPDQRTAQVTCTAKVKVGNGTDFGIQELRIQFRKIDGDWRITRAETVKTLQ